MTLWKNLVVALVAAFVLAACSSSDNGTGTVSNGDSGMTDSMAVEQRAAITTAIGAANTVVAAVGDDSTDAEVKAAEDAIMAAEDAIMVASDVPAEERAANTRTVDAIASRLTAAKMARETAMEEAQSAADTAMAATAMKLHAGIGATPLASSGNGARTAAYSGTDDADITVTIGTEPQELKATKKTVADNHGWEGKQYTASGTGVDGSYEAVVYSDVDDPEEGAKFNAGASDGGYDLTNGVLTIDAAATAAHAARVASSRFDQSAGTKLFKLPDPNPSGATKVAISGSFHGVPGTYSCTPGSGMTCAAQKAAKGFTLGLTDASNSNTFTASDTAWTFKPTNPEARVMSTEDTVYASYGWWLHKGADGKWTASAFKDDKGVTDLTAAGITALQGSATYRGGAAGKYALYSSTGGTNDAGHFTARATLEANFNDDMITGTIDQFMGADGMSRGWSVELKKSGISNTGIITGEDGTDDPMETVWTIGDDAAAAAGQWEGALKDTAATDTDASGVPKVATGTFYSEYNNTGRMVGAFGASRQ